MFTDYCYIKYNSLFKVIDIHGDGLVYIYDDKVCLWKKITMNQFGLYLCYFINFELNCLVQTCYIQLDIIKKQGGDTSNIETLENYIVMIYTFMSKKLNMLGFLTSGAKWLGAKLVDKKNSQLFDNMIGYLPLKNNTIINLSTLEIFQRKKEHYFTFEIPYDYNSNNNDKRFENFI